MINIATSLAVFISLLMGIFCLQSMQIEELHHSTAVLTLNTSATTYENTERALARWPEANQDQNTLLKRLIKNDPHVSSPPTAQQQNHQTRLTTHHHVDGGIDSNTSVSVQQNPTIPKAFSQSRIITTTIPFALTPPRSLAYETRAPRFFFYLGRTKLSNFTKNVSKAAGDSHSFNQKCLAATVTATACSGARDINQTALTLRGQAIAIQVTACIASKGTACAQVIRGFTLAHRGATILAKTALVAAQTLNTMTPL